MPTEAETQFPTVSHFWMGRLDRLKRERQFYEWVVFLTHFIHSLPWVGFGLGALIQLYRNPGDGPNLWQVVTDWQIMWRALLCALFFGFHQFSRKHCKFFWAGLDLWSESILERSIAAEAKGRLDKAVAAKPPVRN